MKNMPVIEGLISKFTKCARFLSMFALGLLILTTIGCNNDDSDVKIQPHDQNTFMTIMHQMMDRMDSMPKTKDADHDYAMMMRMHHQAAIQMANQVISNGDNAQIKSIAQDMIQKQQAEINEFTSFLNSHQSQPQSTSGESFNIEQMDAMKKMMKANDLRVLTGDSDQDFAQLMIDHHQSAIETSEALLKDGKEETTKELAQKIIEDQKKEIDQLQDWLLENKTY